MASGILGQQTGTGDVYTVPASTLAVVNISVLNNDTSNAETVVLRIIPSGATAGNQHNIENISLASRGVLERTAIVLAAGDKINLATASSDVCTSVYGIEESV